MVKFMELRVFLSLLNPDELKAFMFKAYSTNKKNTFRCVRDGDTLNEEETIILGGQFEK